jgi:hypothetical protein
MSVANDDYWAGRLNVFGHFGLGVRRASAVTDGPEDVDEVRRRAQARLNDFTTLADVMADRMVVGMLVKDFTSDEIHLVADRLTIGQTGDLRAMGILGPEEGFDGHGSNGRTPSPPSEDPRAVTEAEER